MNGTRSDWQAEAVCATPRYAGHANLWFPNPEDHLAAKAAQRVCAECPARLACLDDALAEEGSRHVENRFGIRGGATDEDRYRLYARGVRARRRAGVAV